MKTVEFTGAKEVTIREIDKNAWASLGVEDQGMVRWDSSNGHVAEISDAAADRLLAVDPEFKEVHKEKGKPKDEPTEAGS